MKPFLAVFLSSLVLVGCAVGPDFKSPPPPAVRGYTSHLPSITASAQTLIGQQQHFVNGQPIPAQWWEAFHSKPLNELIELALKANPDLQAAKASLRAANEMVLAQQAAYFPNVTGSLSPSRHLTAHTLASLLASDAYLFNLTTPQLNITYVPDVFGANYRQVESLIAQSDVQRFQLEAVNLTLTSNVAMAAIQEASLRAQIKATENSVGIVSKQLQTMRKLQSAGQIGTMDVNMQETVLAQARATLPPLQKQLAQQRHLLTILCGRFPGEELLQKFELQSFRLPRNIPVSLPADLVRQRPDVRISEAQLHQASAQVGVAIANRLPNIMIYGDAGNAAIKLSTLFSSLTKFWDIGAIITQPLFNAGNLLHQQRAAEAIFQQYCAQYHSVLLVAFQNVADTLKAIQYDADALKAAAIAESTARKNLSLTGKEWTLGSVDYLHVLNAQNAYQQTSIILAQNQANRLLDTVALFQALGGGWWNRKASCCNKETL